MAYSVYVIQLENAVKLLQKFKDANPCMDPELPALYVGQTALDPAKRFKQHKQGTKASRMVRNFGLCLAELPEVNTPLEELETRSDAENGEMMLAGQLRVKGYGVWSH
jgi:predicted GIY-YIG superfamily endonuclease